MGILSYGHFVLWTFCRMGILSIKSLRVYLLFLISKFQVRSLYFLLFFSNKKIF
uniref:Candidate secreted effector n=1 Tax=Meloidogyne incognita TaxID=6306 RepID=A0A914KNM5_MELIC